MHLHLLLVQTMVEHNKLRNTMLGDLVVEMDFKVLGTVCYARISCNKAHLVSWVESRVIFCCSHFEDLPLLGLLVWWVAVPAQRERGH